MTSTLLSALGNWLHKIDHPQMTIFFFCPHSKSVVNVFSIIFLLTGYTTGYKPEFHLLNLPPQTHDCHIMKLNTQNADSPAHISNLLLPSETATLTTTLPQRPAAHLKGPNLVLARRVLGYDRSILYV